MGALTLSSVFFLPLAFGFDADLAGGAVSSSESCLLKQAGTPGKSVVRSGDAQGGTHAVLGLLFAFGFRL